MPEITLGIFKSVKRSCSIFQVIYRAPFLRIYILLVFLEGFRCIVIYILYHFELRY